MTVTARLCADLRGVLDRPLTDAERALVADNQGLIGWSYDRICRRCLSLSEADREVLMTCLENRLIRAAQSFDPRRGNKFSTFAVRCLERTGWQDFVRETRRRHRSLDAECNPDGYDLRHDESMLAFLAAPAEDLDDAIDYAARLAWVRKVVGYRDAKLLERRAVLGETLTAIAAGMGISKERVRQILLKAVEKLRRAAERRAS